MSVEQHGPRVPAWESAYCDYFHARQRGFMRTSYAILGSWPAAEDATQTTFTQLYVHWPRIRPGGLDAYARRILVNTCLTAVRSRKRELVVEEVPEASEPPPAHDQRLDLFDALRTLSPRDRAVLALRFLDDLPVAEVAEVLRLPEGTVKSQTSRALDRLQAVLAAPQETSHDH
jgi:RNA polymerase sigma-70 factor (sigma-E family)